MNCLPITLQVSEWEVGHAGLKYDRRWMVVNEGGVYMSQKRLPRLCLIKPTIDLEKKLLILSHPGISWLGLKSHSYLTFLNVCPLLFVGIAVK